MKTETLFKMTSSRNDLADIIQDIVKKTDLEKILLVSASYDYRVTENIFSKKPFQELKNSHYSLLILCNPGKTIFSIKAMQSDAWHFLPPHNLQLFFVDIHDFNRKLAAGEEYASEIASNAMIWYDKEEISLHSPKTHQE